MSRNNKVSFATGITNQYVMNERSKFLFYKLAPKLMMLYFVEKLKVSGVKFEQIQISKIVFKFLQIVEIENSKKQKSPELIQDLSDPDE